MKEKLDEVGFTYYLILARLHDLDPKLHKSEGECISQGKLGIFLSLEFIYFVLLEHVAEWLRHWTQDLGVWGSDF